MYKMIAIDLDDTLLDKDLKISESNRVAINKAREKGVVVALCSGRASHSMRKFLDDLGLNRKGEYYISYNGAFITEANTHRIIYEENVPKKLAHEIIDYGRENNLLIQMYINEELFVEKYNDKVKQYEELTGLKAKVTKDLKKITSDNTIKIMYHDNSTVIKRVYNNLEKFTKDKLHMFISKEFLLEFLSIKTNKGIAVLELGKRLGIKSEEIISIGDSYNDLYMIEMAGLGVAVSNSNEYIKTRADYVTKNDNNKDAVKEVIDKFILM